MFLIRIRAATRIGGVGLGPVGKAVHGTAHDLVAAASLSMIGSILGLLAPSSVYGKETSFLTAAATAHDLVGLVIASPLLVVLAALAVRGSLPGWLCWLCYKQPRAGWSGSSGRLNHTFVAAWRQGDAATSG
jgi:hypothetical protein